MFLFLLIHLFISSIQTCPLKTVDIHSGCYCGIEIDGTNYIHCQPYSIEQIPEFTRSYIHDKLNLSNNFIRNVIDQSFNQLKVKRIYLEQNPIEYLDKHSFDNNILNYLEELYIDVTNNNSIEFLCYGTWKKLRILKLSGFNLKEYQYCFEKLHRLEKLIIQQSSEMDIISYHIYNLPFLYELSLGNNQMEYFNFDDQYLAYSSSIRILNLTSNQLRTIPNDLNKRLPHLITLDLSYNFIENLPLINEITSLNINLSYNLINYFQLNNNQHFIDLSFNPICTMEKMIEKTNILMNDLTNLHCDCRLAYFLKKNLTNKSEQIGIVQLFGNETKCTTPQEINGVFLKDLTYEQLLSTCSVDLPNNCRDVTNFKEIQQYTESIIAQRNTTQIIETAEKLNDDKTVEHSNPISSFRLTSFYTLYENNDLLIFWDFDTILSSNHPIITQFQIIIEQESPSKTEIIRRSGFISPYLKQYIIPHIPSNKNYYVCLLLTQSSYGTDKYCRETKTSTNDTFSHTLFANRSIIFGFLVGTILTTCLLVMIAFMCHLHYKQKRCRYEKSSLYHQQKRYLYIDRNEDDGIYSHSVVSSPLSKYNHLRKNRRRTYLTPTQPWYHRNLTQLSASPRTPCCFLQHHRHTPSSSTTIQHITSLSSEYSNGIEKEQITSTSNMSNTSLDEEQSNIINSPTKHVYEELGDELTMSSLLL